MLSSLSSSSAYRSIYTISSSSSPTPRRGRVREGALPFVDVVRALARTCRFLKSTATKVEIVLITTMIIIQSGSCSYIMQSPTTGNAVLFSIA